MPTLTRAVAMGSREAAREPKARKRTTAATATPMSSAVCSAGASVRATAEPPTSTWSPSPSAPCAASTTAWAWAGLMSLVCAAKVTVA